MEFEESNRFIECCLNRGFEISIDLKNIRMILINDMNKTAFQYPFAKTMLKTFVESLEFANFGKYDEVKQIFVFNQENSLFVKVICRQIKK